MNQISLDHVTVNVNDAEETVSFWNMVFGFDSEGQSGPFTVLRISADLTFQLAPWGTEGGSHFAFAMSLDEFRRVFDILKSENIPYGDSFHSVGTQSGPGIEDGARGQGASVYFNDPNKRLLEIRTYSKYVDR